MTDANSPPDAAAVEVSHPDKCFFPDADLTKADLVAYYRDMAPVMLPHLRDRPLALHRYPDGIGAEGFVQQQASDYFPDWLDTVATPRASGEGEPVRHVLANSAAALTYLANQGTITLHGWLSTTAALNRPDRVVFDLDPPDGGDFAAVVAAARQVRALFEDAGLTAFVMTTGSRGLHVLAPLEPSADFDQVRAWAQDQASALAEAHPDQLTVAQRKDQRGGKLFLDVNRNAYGQTTVQPYSVRAKPGAPVATPVDWDELGQNGFTSQHYHLGNIARRLGQKDDPWQALTRAARPLPSAAGEQK